MKATVKTVNSQVNKSQENGLIVITIIMITLISGISCIMNFLI